MFKESLVPYFSKRDTAYGIIIGLPIYFFVAPALSLAVIKILFGLTGQTMYVSEVNSYHNLFVDAFAAIGIGLVLFQFLKKSMDYYIQNFAKVTLWSLTVGLGINYLGNLVSGLITSFFVSGDSANQEAIVQILEISPVPMVLAVVIFAPIVEELIFRGIIFRSIRRKNVILAHVLSAFTFAFLHCYQGLLMGDWTQLLYLLTYMSPGLVFSYIYEKQKTIMAPILVHIANNLISVIFILIGL